ncbi:MAG: mannose-1-phosphate guanylyltransferase [Treponema sp.]|nr:mannose-1-phosphate guanylyltransferase [Treponema sp.]
MQEKVSLQAQDTFTDVIILAGGIGERLWPASKPDSPKQFMSLPDGVSFIQSSIIRSLALRPSGKIIIITKRDLLEKTADSVQGLYGRISQEEENKLKQDLIVVTEPFQRHTSAPLVLASRMLELKDGKSHTLLGLASDHVISPAEAFVSDCRKAAQAVRNGFFVCFAIPPNSPDTGYGYIKAGEKLSSDGTVARIESFKEKPDLETAKSYLASGSYAWNSGMFAFTSAFFLSEIKKLAPDIYNAFDGLALPDKEEEFTGGIRYVSEWKSMDESYGKVPSIAVDKSVAERTDRAAAVKATFRWDDVGSWDALGKYFEKNGDSTVEVSSKNNFVYSDIPVALCGVDDLTVVIKNGMALVMKKGSSGLMRDVVKAVKELARI